MDKVVLERLNEELWAFYGFCTPAIRWRDWRVHVVEYMQGFIAQVEERRNAENAAEACSEQTRMIQQFLRDAPCDDCAVTARLQQYLASRLTNAESAWAVDKSGFPKQGKKDEWTKDPDRCAAAGVPKKQQGYQAKWQLDLAMLLRAKELGDLQANWVVADDAYGKVPGFHDVVDAEEWKYALEVPSNTPVWPVETTWETSDYSGRGRTPEALPVVAERLPVDEHAGALFPDAWQIIMVAMGAQELRIYLFAVERVRDSRAKLPGIEVWLIHRKNLDGTEPRYYFSNASADTPGEKLAEIATVWWPIETEFETSKKDIGFDEYDVRSWRGWHHHITLCLLANAFLSQMLQEWGKRCP